MSRILPVAVISLLLLAALVYSQRQTEPFHVSGFIEGHEIRVGSRVGGRVLKVLVEEGAAVKAGQPLLELEPYLLTAEKLRAVAQLAEAEAELAKRQSGLRDQEIAQAEARVQQLTAAWQKLENGPRDEEIAAAAAMLELAQAQQQLAVVNQKRTQELLNKGKTAQDLDQANTELRVAQATVRARDEELKQLQRGSRVEDKAEAAARLEEARQALALAQAGFRTEEIDHARAARDAAQAAVDSIDRQCEELVIRAPADGRIEAIDLRPGDLVGANTPAVSLLDSSSLWVRTYVPENRLNLQLEQTVRLTVDSFPDEELQGRITFISQQAEFTPSNVQTPEDRSRQVFRIKVEITTGRETVRPGMIADVWTETSPSR